MLIRDSRAGVVQAAQKLHMDGLYHGALLTGNRETGLKLTNNIRVTEDNNKVVLVNFEHATKHKGFGCLSAESGSELKQLGCQELDDLYELYAPWRMHANVGDSDESLLSL